MGDYATILKKLLSIFEFVATLFRDESIRKAERDANRVEVLEETAREQAEADKIDRRVLTDDDLFNGLS